MATMIDEFLIAMGLDANGVKKGAKEAENAISGMSSAITAKLGVLSAAAMAAFSVFARFGEYVSQADSMGKLADALDVDIEKMHAWGEAAARAGGSVEGFQGSLQSLTTQLARQATVGTSRAAKMLEGVGIDAGEIGRQRQAFDVMMDLAEKAETMGKQEFFGLGRSLGLDQGTIMLLQQGRTALKDAIQAQKEFGVYTKEDAKLTADWNDRVADFGQVMKSFSAIIFRMILPAMTKFVEWTNKAVAFLRKHEAFVQAFFIGLAAVIMTIFLPALASMAAALLANPITWFIAALAALAIIIEDLVVWANGGESAFAELWEAIFGSPEEAQKTWEAIKTGFFELLDAIAPVLEWLKENLIAAFKAVIPWIAKFVRTSIELITGLKNTFNDLARHIQNVLGAAFNWVIEKWNAVAAVLGMTKINVQANVVSSAADGNHGGGGSNFGDFVTASDSLPMGGASNVTNNTDTRVNVGTVNITAADGNDAGNQFMDSVESRASSWTANANVAYD